MNPGFPIHLLVCWPRIPLGCWCLMFEPCQRGLELAPSQLPVPCCGWGCGSMCFVHVTGHSACCRYWGFPPGLLCVLTHPHSHLYGARAGAGHTGIEKSVHTGLRWPHVWVCLSSSFMCQMQGQRACLYRAKALGKCWHSWGRIKSFLLQHCGKDGSCPVLLQAVRYFSALLEQKSFLQISTDIVLGDAALICRRGSCATTFPSIAVG